MRVLWTGDDALGFEEALRFNLLKCLRKLFFEFSEHRTADYAEKTNQETMKP